MVEPVGDLYCLTIVLFYLGCKEPERRQKFWRGTERLPVASPEKFRKHTRTLWGVRYQNSPLKRIPSGRGPGNPS
ncbi:hypothetical protein DPMN_086591 [Dreissena polymorpha]|uniref:Uncharacterized protein n=1 Tax=Dreissena polymorpha TaxID=45954 RepID=A0A9D4QVC4_DREPO|nr:hypothetical protein DPMN_086591 [Dreissena polymorpha]